MTAEIAVMNKYAVALAADSKVTISGMKAAKTYDTVNKVFTLSKVHPIGIMIYGNAEFMQYPWETVIKLYRRQKKACFEKTVEAWGADFVKYLKKFGKIEASHKQENAKRIIVSWFSLVQETAELKARRKGISPAADEFEQILVEQLQAQELTLRNAGSFCSISKAKKIGTAYVGLIADLVEDVFETDDVDSELFKAAVTLAAAALFSSRSSPQSSGFAITGFGEEEYFPALVDYETDGYVLNDLKIVKKSASEVRRENPSCVKAFAQADMVQRFMQGADVQLMATVASSYQRLVTSNCMAILDNYGLKKAKTDKVRGEITKAIDESLKKLKESISKYTNANFVHPVVQMVALLPKDELAHLAESLVALTSLKRRVSSDAETVGGPVDVALISKGDGFVWIKRKLYFSEKLNTEFIRNYMYDIYAEGAHHA